MAFCRAFGVGFTVLFFLAPDSLVSLVFGGTSLRHAIVDTLRLRVKVVTAYLFTSIKLFTVADPSGRRLGEIYAQETSFSCETTPNAATTGH